jgi:quercetin dioxygenase-like cupin family protein
MIPIQINGDGNKRVWAINERKLPRLSHNHFCEKRPMSIEHFKSGESIQLPLGANLPRSKTTTLVKTTDLELIRLVLPAGKEIPTHKALGEITVQCLEGRVAFTVASMTQELTTGQLIYLAADQPHSVKGIEDSTVLVTLLLTQRRTRPANFDPVQEAGEESFPASDSPAF